MAFQTFILNPSSDIHLIRNPSSHSSLQVEALGYDDAVTPAVQIITGQCNYNIVDTSIATVNNTTGLLTAVADGITFLVVTFTDPVSNQTFELVARVWVHDSISQIFLGNNSASVNVGSDNFQITLFAEFNNGVLEDIAGHPYVTYNSAPAFVNVDPFGRLTGIATGSTQVQVENALNGALVGNLPVEIKPALSTARPIVERVTFKGNGQEKRNILFLAEGFSAAEQGKFKRIVRQIDRRMRGNRIHDPFKLLSPDYNTWMAFEPSPESGLTFGPLLRPRNLPNQRFVYSPFIENVAPNTAGNFSLFELIDLVGLPDATQVTGTSFTMTNATSLWAGITGFSAARLEAGIFNTWQDIVASERLKPKTSALGLILGKRLGDRFASLNPEAPDNSWHRIQHDMVRNFLYVDFRRVSSAINPISSGNPSSTWSRDLFEYLGSLRQSNVPATDPLFNLGDKWRLDGDDQGLVIVLVNEEVQGANYHLSSIFGGISTGLDVGIDNTSLSGGNLLDHTPNTPRTFIEALTAIVIHELCHGLFLGDEYEDFANIGNNTIANPADIADVERFHNLSTVANINSIGLKWRNFLPRVQRSSGLLTAATNSSTSANSVEFDLFPGEGSKWNVGDTVLLATRNLNQTGGFGAYPSYLRHQATITPFLTISAIANDRITASGITTPAGGVFPKGSMLFDLLVHQGTGLSLVLPGVINHMLAGTPPNVTINNFLSLGKTVAGGMGCNTANQALVNTTHPIANVNIQRAQRHFLIGMHEGGGNWNCGVVRPAAVCKMRSAYFGPANNVAHFRFCHVCKYHIVHQFNPSKHALLDNQYPGTP